ncbi:MAG: coproporphyrinogen III oxidase family protein [Verrucomicrobia bacterium]|jgi:oxygen-independent coproporphyrinogen-3 oxidase|nr:coproporphyrinogen III oxidase family protein [Verrucomicrobiota bacterium]MCU0786180.1 coproporphyrinogen III oxidase family protein [Verrucomicrobiota bacterium]
MLPQTQSWLQSAAAAPDARDDYSRPAAAEPVVGNYFVAAYPPFSAWTEAQVPALHDALGRHPTSVPLGVYVHLPFCHHKCDYCYYLSYIGQPAAVINRYLDTVMREAALYAAQPAVKERPVAFGYFGGGTPSLLSVAQLSRLMTGLRAAFRWDAAEEITFECAPRSVTRELLAALRESGVTRVSMGVQSFDDGLLALNGRVHRAADVRRAYVLIAAAGFAQVNLDLMCGLLGETDAHWHATLQQVLELQPDAVTLYQTEIPRNTRLAREFEAGMLPTPPPSWEVKRARLDAGRRAFEEEGYTATSAYNLVRDPARQPFRYQDLLWRGADMLGLGVASFGYVGGVHYQNQTKLEAYEAALAGGALPLQRAFPLTPGDQLIREFILQLKLGRVDLAPLHARFGVDPLERFAAPLKAFADDGWLTWNERAVELTRAGLLRVDRLLPAFYDARFQTIRYS